MIQSSWLAAGVVPGIERRPLKKLYPDPTVLLRLVEGWRDHAMKAGRMITRIVLAFEAGRDGFWLARWFRARSIETFVIHSTSVAVSRERRTRVARWSTLKAWVSGLRSEAGCAKPRLRSLESLPSFCTECGSKAPNSNGYQRRPLISLRSRTTEFPPTSGSERPCRGRWRW